MHVKETVFVFVIYPSCIKDKSDGLARTTNTRRSRDMIKWVYNISVGMLAAKMVY